MYDQIWQFNLRRGNSFDPRNGACLLDAVSWFEYGKLGDHPECVCPVIAAYARRLNDDLPDGERQELKRFLPRLVGTVDVTAEKDRAEYAVRRVIREILPRLLRARGYSDQAKACEDLSSLASMDECKQAASAAYAYAAKGANGAYADNAANAATAASTDYGDYAYAASASAASAASAAYTAAYTADYTANLINYSEILAVSISILDGMLAIGRQADPPEDGAWATANKKFALVCED
jgi:hypothetical protein